MIRFSDSVTALPRITDPPILSLLRIGQVGHDDHAAGLIVGGGLTDSDMEELPMLSHRLWRWALLSNTIPDHNRSRLAAALVDLGMNVTEMPALPSSVAELWQDAQLRRGSMNCIVRSVCVVLAGWRTLWRTNGQAALLELPIGEAVPWLRPLDVAEVETLIDALGVGVDRDHGVDDYLLSRVALAVHAFLPSWLPPAGDVRWSEADEKPGYDATAQRIVLAR